MTAHPLMVRDAVRPGVADALNFDGFHVDGYGVWRDLGVTLQPGLNLFHGPNEVGKSTLHAFLRHMLFGIPDGRFKENSHPPLRGGEHGGRLFLSRGGKGIELRRHVRSRTAALFDREGSPLPPSLLDGWLHGVDAQLFRNLYAFGVEELAELDTLTGDAIGARLFDAGLEGAGRSVSSWLEVLKKRKEAELRPRSGRIRQWAREVEAKRRELEEASAGSGTYVLLLEKERGLEKQLEEIATEEEAVRSQLDRLSRVLASWPLELRRREAEATLAQRAAWGPLAQDALGRFDRALGDMQRLEQEALDLEAEIADRREAWRAAAPDPHLEPVEGQVLAAFAEIDLQADRERRLDLLEAAIREKEAVVRERRERAGVSGGSSPSATGGGPEIGTSLASIEAREAALACLRAANARHDEASRRLVEFGMATGWRGRGGWALGGALLLFMSGLWIATGPRLPWGWVVSAAGGIWCGVLLWLLRSEARQSNGIRIRLEADRKSAAEEVRLHTRQLGFDAAGPGPMELERAQSALEKERRLCEALSSLRQVREEATALRLALQQWNQKVGELLSLAGRGGSGRAGLLALVTALEEDRKRRSTRREIEASLLNLERRLQRVLHEKAERGREMGLLLEEAGVADREGLEEAHRSLEARLQAERSLDEVGRLLDENFGTGPEAEAALEDLRSGEKLAWEAAITGLRERLDVARSRRSRLHEEVALLRHQRQGLETSTRVPALATEAEGLRAQLDASVERYRVSALLEHLLQSTLERFRQERQPAVLRHAGEAFTQVTGGRYLSLRQPLGALDVEAVDASGLGIPSRALSRGTRDQLYLCLRLGLTEAFAERGTRLPLLMDDVLVHFDPVRAEAMAEVLAGVARRQQILFFTCHPQTVDRLLAAAPATHLIELRRPEEAETGFRYGSARRPSS